MNDIIDAAPESEQATDTAEAPLDALEADATIELTDDAPETDLVRSLRLESRGRKDKIRTLESRIAELEVEVGDHRTYRLEHAVREVNASRMRPLADTSDLMVFTPAADLLADDGKPDANKIGAALDQLIDKKPHLSPRVSWDSGIRGSTVPPPAPSLGGLIGRAARGED